MKNRLVRIGIVFGIILLFICVGIQPAFAVDVSKSISDNEGDCNLCAKMFTGEHLIKLNNLIEKLNILDNKLSVVAKSNSELDEKYQELSDKITKFKEVSNELNPKIQNNNDICDILFIFIGSYMIIWITLDELHYRFSGRGRFFMVLLVDILAKICRIIFSPYLVLWLIFCYPY